MKYYATSEGFCVTEDIYEGGMLRHEANSEPYLDLFVFATKEERDNFVAESKDHKAIMPREVSKIRHLNEQRRRMKW